MGKRIYAPLYWFDFPHPRKPLPVWWMDDEMHPPLRTKHPLDGETVAHFVGKDWMIIFWAGLEKEHHAPLLFHESGHSIWDHDVEHMSSMNEERALCCLQNGMSDSLLKMGWTIPELPEGWRSLQQHARYVRYGRASRSHKRNTE